MGSIGVAASSTQVTVGEVHTALLQHSSAVSAGFAERLLDIVVGERVVRSERPIAYASSPSVLTGVHCPVPTLSGTRVVGVGTAMSHATLTGGHIVQGCAYSTIMRGPVNRRLPWSHYLANPGIVETVTKVDTADVGAGFFARKNPEDGLDLNAIGRRTVDAIQAHKDLDRDPGIQISRLRLRWIIGPAVLSEAAAAEPGDVVFAINDRSTRTVRIPRISSASLRSHVEFLEDLARHDWLLTAITALLEQARVGARDRFELIDRLQPAVDHLLHLWMPAARTDPVFTPFWQAFDLRPGFSRQWQVSVDRVRDQLALGALTLLRARPEEVIGVHDE